MAPAPLSRCHDEELLDHPEVDPLCLEENLLDLRRVNRNWGGMRPLLEAVRAVLDEWPPDRTVRLLDMGTGGADLCTALVRMCRDRGLSSLVVGLDRSRPILTIARNWTRTTASVSLVQADALAPPFLPRSFDFVLSNLVLHHIPIERGAEFLRRLTELTREGVAVSDLRRGRWEYFCVRVFSRLVLKGSMARTDGPRSVLRSLTLAEARKLVREAGWSTGVVERRFPLRLLLLHRRGR